MSEDAAPEEVTEPTEETPAVEVANDPPKTDDSRNKYRLIA